MEAKAQQQAKIQDAMGAYLSDFHHLPCGVAVVKNDVDSTILQGNPMFYQMIGHTVEAFWNHHANRLANILVDHVQDALFQKRLDQDYDLTRDLRVRTAEGQIRWLHTSAHYHADLDVFFLLSANITERLITTDNVLSYEAFQARNAILGYVNQYISEHIVVSDPTTDQVVYMNQSAASFFGFSQESDWLGKSYGKIRFGDSARRKSYKQDPLTETDFTVSEYFNHFLNIYVHKESKLITVPTLGRKLRLDILSDITGQQELERTVLLQKTLHKCMDALFTSGTSNQDAEDAYSYILGQIKRYYHGDSAFFYQFVDGSHDVGAVYSVSEDSAKKANHNLPITMSDQQLKIMHALSAANPAHTKNVIASFPVDFAQSLMAQHAAYHIENFVCTAICNQDGHMLAFLGVTNPKTNQDTKELMELLSRFLCMFLEHQQNQRLKEEALKLEEISKVHLLEKCRKNSQSFAHADENIADTLDGLCQHYDAEFAVVLAPNPDGTCRASHIGGLSIPNLLPLEDQPGHIMEKWIAALEAHPQFLSNEDFVTPQANAIKTDLAQQYGIHNFVVSPIHDHKENIIGLLFVNNFRLLNRSRLMIHVVAKNISDYLAKMKMYQKAQLEPLTRLANKVATETRISKYLAQGSAGTLFILDVDNFKGLNDTLGHQVGDQALVEIATILTQHFRSTDVIGRIGGDEFMIFSPGHMPQSFLLKKANQVLDACQLGYEKDGLTAQISISMGICPVDHTCNTFQSLYESADHALYTAKKQGKNGYYLHT